MKLKDYGYQIHINTYSSYDGYIDTTIKFDDSGYAKFCSEQQSIINDVSIIIHGKAYGSKRFWQDRNLEDYFRYHGRDKIKPFDILEKLLHEHKHFAEY